ncbi:hypothetical protein GCM10017744_103520 [Streptomyces antimycoticus]
MHLDSPLRPAPDPDGWDAVDVAVRLGRREDPVQDLFSPLFALHFQRDAVGTGAYSADTEGVLGEAVGAEQRVEELCLEVALVGERGRDGWFAGLQL